MSKATSKAQKRKVFNSHLLNMSFELRGGRNGVRKLAKALGVKPEGLTAMQGNMAL